jgi:Tol biopolymer transport system component
VQAGTRTLSASFAAQGRWSASGTTTPLAVGSLRIARNTPNVSRRGQGVSVIVDLDISPFMTDPQPSGLLTVGDGVDSCQIALPRNECVWYGSTPGVRTLTATWAGDVNFPARTSAPVSQEVVDTPPELELVTTGVRAYADANGTSTGNASALSADGRYVVFLSDATNFVPGDTNGLADIFVRDQKGGLIRRVNTSSSGEQANGTCADPAISANGRYVAFNSLANNLVPDDTNNVRDVFLKDLATGSTVRVSVHSDGSQATVDNEFSGMPLSISADGRFVAFLTFARLLPRDTNIHSDVYVKDMQTGELDLVSTASDETLANFRNNMPAISPDGRYVAFASQASNFVPEDTTITLDIYLKDRVTRSIRLVSSNAAGTSGGDNGSFRPVVSSGGRYVAFMSIAHNLITPDINYTDIYVKDMQTGAIERANTTASGVTESNDADLPSISADGRYVAFQSKYYAPAPNAMTRIYVKDRQSGALMRGDRLSTGVFQTSGISLAPAISADGRFVSFHSASTGFVTGDVNGLADVHVHDLNTGLNQRAALPGGVAADGASAEASLSRDGRYVVFASAATNLMEDAVGGRQVFIHDRIAKTTQRMSRGNGWGNADSDSPIVSANGQWIAYRSAASNLVNNDTNGKPDVFLIHRTGVSPLRLSVSGSNVQTTTGTILGPVTVNADGVLTVFRASDTTLVAGDTNGFEDVFLHNRVSFGTSLVSANAAGVTGNGHSTHSIISDNGARVAFTSLATNLLASDDNGVADIYVKQLADGSVLRASSDAAGVLGNGASSEPSLSSNGRYVAFVSAASNLVAGDDNGRNDIFVKDLTTGSIVRANLSSAGQQGTGGDCGAPALSSDGQQVGFICTQAGLVDGPAAGTPQAFVKQLPNGVLRRVSVSAAGQPANAPSSIGPRALADNGLLTLSTAADNLLPGDVQPLADVFVVSARETPVAATTTTITAHTPDPVLLGQPYTVSVSVTRAAGSGTGDITGTVNINDGTAFCSTPLTGSGDSAGGGCALLSNSTGTKPLRAAYAGDLNHSPSDAAPVTHVVIAPGAPSAPFIGAVERGNAQVAVSFLPPAQGGGSPIGGYTASCGAMSSTGSASPIIVGGLTNGIAVTCRVRASNGSGLGAWSEMSASVTPATVPAAPTGAAATRGNGQVSVAFNASPDNGGAVVVGFIARCSNASQSGTASPIVVSGLTNGVAVSCTVAAVNEIGEGPQSAPAASVTPATLPSAPLGVIATRGNGQASVTFAAPADNGGATISGYVARCGSASQIGASPPLVVGGLINGVAVSCTVAAVNEVGEGTASAPSASVTPANVPDAPTNVVATRGNAQVSVAFTPPAVDGGSVVTGYTASCGSASQTGLASPIVVTGLANGTPVTCQATARNDIGDSAASAPSDSVTPATVPAAPQLATAVGTANGTGAVLTFAAPDTGGSTITGYEARCTPGTHIANGTASPLTVSGLAPGNTFACTVSASNDVGMGSASDSLSVTPRIQADLAVSNSNGVSFISGGNRPDWLVEVHNPSSNAVTGARVQMTLPAQLTGLAWLCTAQGGGACPAASGSGALDALVNLPAGARVSFLVSATVPKTPELPLQTTATVSVSGVFTDPQTGNDTATDGPDTVGIFRAGFQ